MINEKLINPDSIVVVGGSDDLFKPGGKILKNIIDGNYSGKLYVVNPKQDMVQGIKSTARYQKIFRRSDLAILADSGKVCACRLLRYLLKKKNTKAFIIISAGFSESGEEGKKLENEIADLINEAGACLIGPNCIGVITRSYHGVFTTPVPKLSRQGL